jgi:hypothetical protein
MSQNIREDLITAPKKRAYMKNSKGYSPSTYVSIQDRVNKEPAFKREYFNKLAEEGWKELANVRDMERVKPGVQIKYILNGKGMSGDPPGTFRSGGFFQSVGNNKEFILFKGFNGSSFSLQFKDIESLYVKGL